MVDWHPLLLLVVARSLVGLFGGSGGPWGILVGLALSHLGLSDAPGA